MALNHSASQRDLENSNLSVVNTCDRKLKLIWFRLLIAMLVLLFFPIRRLLYCLVQGTLQMYRITINSSDIFSADVIEFSNSGISRVEPSSSVISFASSANDTRPQLLLILGGDAVREIAGVQYFTEHRHLFSNNSFILLSSGTLSRNQLLNETKIPPELLITDTTAVDTLTNFTRTIPHLMLKQRWLIAIATSTAHLPRAIAIASIVLGSSGIKFFTVELPPYRGLAETRWKCIRDTIRSIVWLITDIDFRNLVVWYKSMRNQ